MDIESRKFDEKFKSDLENIYAPPKSDVSQKVKESPVNRIKGFTLVLKAPPLMTVNGIGFRLYGRSRIIEGDDSYLATYYFTVFFLPLLPLNRYCVVEVSRGQYHFLGSIPLRIVDKIHMALGVFLVTGMIAYLTQH